VLEPFGIPRRSHFTWDRATLDDIHLRNRGDAHDPASPLRNATFLLPSHPAHPFPVNGMTLLGPTRASPFRLDDRGHEYTLLEVTPLYIGQASTAVRTYLPRNRTRAAVNLTVGGYIEPFAFGGGAPLAGIAAGETMDVLRVPVPPEWGDGGFGIANATLASSWAVGPTVDALGLDSVGGLVTDYWAPAAEGTPATEPHIIADGGVYENVHLIGMIKRRVENIIVFLNTNQPLHSNATWDSQHRAPTSATTSDMWPWFFGVPVWPADVEEVLEQSLSFYYGANQVFAKEDYYPVVARMQAAQQTGNGIVVTTELTTVENTHWGVSAGIRVNVTWVYLSRAGEWERRLGSDAIRDLVVPAAGGAAGGVGVGVGGRASTAAEDGVDYGETVQTGPFQGFPNYATDAPPVYWSEAKANILASQTGWTVLQNADIFRTAFGEDVSNS
jgi:hypothetical protein